MRLLTLLMLVSVGCSKTTESKPCSVQGSESGSTIVCPDGTSQFVANGKNGDNAVPIIQGVKGEAGAKGDVGADGKTGETGKDGLQGAQGEKADTLKLDVFVWNASGEKIGKFMGGSVAENVVTKLSDETLVAIDKEGTVQPVPSYDMCHYTEANCQGVCYVANNTKNPVGSYLAYDNNGYSKKYGRLSSTGEATLLIKSYHDTNPASNYCYNWGSTIFLLQSWAVMESYSLAVSSYKMPLDIRIGE